MKFRPKFSLRFLLLALATVCVLVGASTWWYRAQKTNYQLAMKQANELSAQGATLEWENEIPGWLHWIGDAQRFQRISSIHGWQPESISDAQCEWLAGLKAVGLQLTADMLDEKMVSKLASLKPLKELLILPPLPGGRDVSEHEYRMKMQPEISSKLPGVHVVIGRTWHRTPLRGDTPRD